MSEVQVSKRLFRKRIVATETTDSTLVKVTGEKGLFSRAVYQARISIHNQKGFHMVSTRLGRFKDVADDLRCDEEAKKGIPLLREVAEALSDDSASHGKVISEDQMKVIAVLKGTPRKSDELSSLTWVNSFSINLALTKLHNIKIVEWTDGAPGDRTINLTPHGNELFELLLEDRKFQEIQNKLKKLPPRKFP